LVDGGGSSKTVNSDAGFTASTNSCKFAIAPRAGIPGRFFPGDIFFGNRSAVLHPSSNTLQISRGMSRLEGKVLVAQGGGPTAVINQSIVGVTLEARKFTQVKAVYGAIHGVQGILKEDFLDLTRETTHNLEQVAETPSSALLSTRDKPDEEYCARMFKVMRKHDIRYFFYVGGNDSSDTVRIVNRHAEEAGYDFRAVHIPKTIDNDLLLNDHCPGFGSAARFVTQAFIGLNLDNRALSGVLIGVVMGRHAGFLTASSSLARKYFDEGPHLIYLPERPFSTDKFLADVDRVYKEHGLCMVAVSEGIQDEHGTAIAQTLSSSVERDAHGNIQLSGSGIVGDLLADRVKKKLNIKRVRADTFGYLQRSFLGVVSDRDAHEAREVGEIAVQYAMWDNVDGSVVIRRPVLNYSVSYDLVPLADVAGKTRTMPDEFINSEANGVTIDFYNYCRPLIGASVPTHHRLRAPRVPKLPD
jgi:ATP-dependent phosphofructokinase / diphosphate-dependent phosphofructokinase